MFEKQRILIGDKLLPRKTAVPVELGLREAIDWLYRAQDGSPDRGVSHSYALGKGWAPSYPETTGYIIPTLLNWCQLSGEQEARRRALEMADWESQIQLEDGGVMASVLATPPKKPVVFNTGQVIFGWLAAYRATQKERFLDSASRAAGWLLDKLGTKETWESHGSMGADRLHTYNIRVVWAILEFAKTLDDHAFEEPLRRAIEWVLGQETSKGWFANNCLTENDRPLLHTIAYTARGLLETGLLLGDDRCVGAARRTADALIAKIQPSGSMAGRFDACWKESTKWACLTGMAQMSIVWQKLFAMTGETRYRDGARLVNRFLRTMQRIRCGNGGIRGGIAGSWPVNGEYGKYRMLNWATKFYVDALLLEANPTEVLSADWYPG